MKYIIETKLSKKNSTKEKVEADNAFHALSISKLAIQPFQRAIIGKEPVAIVITNADDDNEVLELNHKF